MPGHPALARVVCSKRSYRFLPQRAAFLAALPVLALGGAAHSQALTEVAGSVPAGAFAPNAAAAPAAGSVLHLVIGLSGVKRAERDAFLKSQYDPASPNFHKWLTPEQYGEKFGASPQDVQAVVDYATAQGFHVTKVWPNRSFVSVDATAGQAEAALGVRLQGFDRPAKLVAQGEPATFYAPSAAPSVPSSVASRISFIGGLSSATVLRPANAGHAAFSNLVPGSASYTAASPAPAIGRAPVYLPIHPAGASPAGTPFAGPLSPAQISTLYNVDYLHRRIRRRDASTPITRWRRIILRS
jgi:subtilase family serine protease